jgi:type I restriction enzyme S subunit
MKKARRIDMDTKKLRQKILDLAIRGKLVPQDPNDEPASVLLERIRAEKERLIKEGKIKRSKKSASDTPRYENEAPFEVPESWEWCIVDDFAYVASGSTPSKDSFVEEGVPYIKMYNLRNQKIDFDFHPQYIKREVHEGRLQRSKTEVGDLIMNIVGPPLGKLAIIPPSLPESNFNQAAVLIRPYFYKDVLVKYLFYYLSEMSEINSIATKGSAGQVNISLTQSQNMRIALPPIEEQKRIIKTIENLFHIVDTIDKGSIDIAMAIGKAKSKILDLAIHGKLVPQDPNEEPAIELLKRINPKFTPCDNAHYENVPSFWALARVEDIGQLISGRDLTNDECNSENMGLPYLIGASNIEGDTFSFIRWTEKPQVISQMGDILISCKGTIGAIVKNDIGDMHIARQFMAIRPNTNCITSDYLHICLIAVIEEIKKDARGVIPGIAREDILTKVFPIPPLHEQQRIIAAINEYNRVLDNISANL